jgi:hypothetical protein
VGEGGGGRGEGRSCPLQRVPNNAVAKEGFNSLPATKATPRTGQQKAPKVDSDTANVRQRDARCTTLECLLLVLCIWRAALGEQELRESYRNCISCKSHVRAPPPPTPQLQHATGSLHT